MSEPRPEKSSNDRLIEMRQLTVNVFSSPVVEQMPAGDSYVFGIGHPEDPVIGMEIFSDSLANAMRLAGLFRNSTLPRGGSPVVGDIRNPHNSGIRWNSVTGERKPIPARMNPAENPRTVPTRLEVYTESLGRLHLGDGVSLYLVKQPVEPPGGPYVFIEDDGDETEARGNTVSEAVAKAHEIWPTARWIPRPDNPYFGKGNPPRSTGIDEPLVHELISTIATYWAKEYDQYNRLRPISDNLYRKWMKKTYDGKLAEKLWLYFAEDAARYYFSNARRESPRKDFGWQTLSLREAGDPATRREVARILARYWERKMEIGEIPAPKSGGIVPMTDLYAAAYWGAERYEKRINPVHHRAGGGKLSIPMQHAVKIALKTLRMPDAMVGVMGPPTKEQARETLKSVGYSDATIAKYEGPQEFRESEGGKENPYVWGRPTRFPSRVWLIGSTRMVAKMRREMARGEFRPSDISKVMPSVTREGRGFVVVTVGDEKMLKVAESYAKAYKMDLKYEEKYIPADQIGHNPCGGKRNGKATGIYYVHLIGMQNTYRFLVTKAKSRDDAYLQARKRTGERDDQLKVISVRPLSRRMALKMQKEMA